MISQVDYRNSTLRCTTERNTAGNDAKSDGCGTVRPMVEDCHEKQGGALPMMFEWVWGQCGRRWYSLHGRETGAFTRRGPAQALLYWSHDHVAIPRCNWHHYFLSGSRWQFQGAWIHDMYMISTVTYVYRVYSFGFRIFAGSTSTSESVLHSHSLSPPTAATVTTQSPGYSLTRTS